MENVARPNKLFKRNGHSCSIYDNFDPVAEHIPGTNWRSRWKRTILRYTICSETNDMAIDYLRSQALIRKEKIRQLNEHKYFIIHPFSKFRTFWECIIVLNYFVGFIVKPIKSVLFFWCLPKETPIQVNIINYMMLSLDYMDISFSFICGYYDPKTHCAVLSMAKIAKAYLLTYFVPDIVSDIPFDVIFSTFGSTRSRLFEILDFTFYLTFFRFPRMVQFGRRIIRVLKLPVTPAMSIGILLTIALFMHVFLCLCIVYMQLFAIENTIFLGIDCDKRIHTVVKQYVYFYYQLMREITLAAFPSFMGYGIVVFIQAIVTWGVMWILLIKIIAAIYIIMNRSHPKNKYEDLIQQMKNYIKSKRLPDYMHRRLLVYYEFRYHRSFFKEAELLNTLGTKLKNEILSYNYMNMIRKVAFFHHVPPALILRLANYLQLEVYLPNDVIIVVDQPGDCMYFIATGTVAAINAEGEEKAHLEDNDYFGELALVQTNARRYASMVAVDISELYRLDRKHFITAMTPYPELLTKIEHIALVRLAEIIELYK